MLVSVRKGSPQKAMKAMVAGGTNVKNFLMNSITSMRVMSFKPLSSETITPSSEFSNY
jgi:hypothetical protein